MKKIMRNIYQNSNRAGTAFIALMRHILDILPRWQERALERRHLMALDDRLLKDIGVNRLDAWQEFNKPFWRP